MSRLAVPKVYAQHILALFVPGRGAPVHEADKNVAGDISSWSDAQVKTLIDEGRRQIDRQNDDLERVRGRAQVTLTLGLALAGAAGSLRAAVSFAHVVGLWAMWILGLAFVAFATLGAAATAVVRADIKMIHAAVLSKYEGDIDRQLARDYANIAATGEKQIATRLTNLWLAVALLLAGAALTLGAWLWADAARSEYHRSHPLNVHTHTQHFRRVQHAHRTRNAYHGRHARQTLHVRHKQHTYDEHLDHRNVDVPPTETDTAAPSTQRELPYTR